MRFGKHIASDYLPLALPLLMLEMMMILLRHLRWLQH